MNSVIKQLLVNSGFCLWDKEPWAPPGAVIDWNCDYTQEFDQFVERLIMTCANVAAMVPDEADSTYLHFNDSIYDRVINHFNYHRDNHNNDYTPYEPTEIDEWNDYDKDC
jgi:hypothetical protein